MSATTNWNRINDDTFTATYNGIKLEVNYMRTHWAWIVTDGKDFPLAGSFLNGRFMDSKESSQNLCLLYAEKYLEDQTKFLTDLQDKTNQKFDVTLSLTGMQAILISMILFDGTQNGTIKIGEDDIDGEESVDMVNDISKSIIKQWGDYSERFESFRA